MRSCSFRQLGDAIIASAIPLLFAAALGAQQQTVTLGGRQVVVWRPKDAATGRHATLIFSHGLNGCATQSKFLTEALAEHGYWVFALNHNDAHCGGQGGRRGRGGRGDGARPQEPLRDPQKWTDHTYVDRADDIRAVLKALAESPEFGSQVDLTRLGLIGHSLGGYTVVGLSGGWLSWKIPGVKAVLALSPYVQPYLAHSTLSGLSAPVMYQGGTVDLGITPWLRKTGGAYDSSPPSKYFVDFTGAGHLAWTDLRSDTHQRILDYSIPFLDHYVRGMPASDALTKTESGVTDLRYQSELGSSGRR